MNIFVFAVAGAAICAASMGAIVGVVVAALKLSDIVNNWYNAKVTKATSILSVNWRYWPGFTAYMAFLFGCIGAACGVIAYFATGSAA